MDINVHMEIQDVLVGLIKLIADGSTLHTRGGGKSSRSIN